MFYWMLVRTQKGLLGDKFGFEAHNRVLKFSYILFHSKGQNLNFETFPLRTEETFHPYLSRCKGSSWLLQSTNCTLHLLHLINIYCPIRR
jgi:hypothetical protein